LAFQVCCTITTDAGKNPPHGGKTLFIGTKSNERECVVWNKTARRIGGADKSVMVQGLSFARRQEQGRQLNEG